MRTLQAIVILGLLVSCRSGEMMEGLWAIQNDDPDEHLPLNRIFWEFKEGRIYSIQFGDPEKGDMASIFRDTLEFELEGDMIIIGEAGYMVERHGEKMILRPEEEDMMSFSLLNVSGLARTELGQFDCFLRSYRYNIPSQDDPITLDFINDSIVLFTGDHREPAQRYDLMEIDGVAILNIHNLMHPIMTISTCSQDQLVLKNPSQDRSVVLTPTSSDRRRTDLIGRWEEMQGDPKPPAPPGITLADQYRTVQFSEETITIEYMGHTSTSTWDLSDDGRYIYFIDRIFEPDGSWRVIELNDSFTTVSLRVGGMGEEEVIRLERVL